MKKIFGLFWTFFGVVITTLVLLAINEIQKSTDEQENKVETVISAGLTVGSGSTIQPKYVLKSKSILGAQERLGYYYEFKDSHGNLVKAIITETNYSVSMK